MNRHLLKDLCSLDLWSKAIKNEIISNNGSVQKIKVIPEEIRELYKTSYEIKQKTLINLAKMRAPFIDQSQSLNLFIEGSQSTNISKTLSSMHMYSYDEGLKTGIYYLRYRPSNQALKFNVEQKTAEKKVVDKMTRIYGKVPKEKKTTIKEKEIVSIVSLETEDIPLTVQEIKVEEELIQTPLVCNRENNGECMSCSG